MFMWQCELLAHWKYWLGLFGPPCPLNWEGCWELTHTLLGKIGSLGLAVFKGNLSTVTSFLPEVNPMSFQENVGFPWTQFEYHCPRAMGFSPVGGPFEGSRVYGRGALTFSSSSLLCALIAFWLLIAQACPPNQPQMEWFPIDMGLLWNMGISKLSLLSFHWFQWGFTMLKLGRVTSI